MCGVFCVVLLKLALLSTFWPTSEDIKSHIIIITFLCIWVLFQNDSNQLCFFVSVFFFFFFFGGGGGGGEGVVCLSFLFSLEKGWTKNMLSRLAPLIKTVLT